eukprot:3826020-Rhodomonas_salina.1
MVSTAASDPELEPLGPLAPASGRSLPHTLNLSFDSETCLGMQSFGGSAGDTLECEFYCEFFAVAVAEELASGCNTAADCERAARLAPRACRPHTLSPAR